MKSKLKLRHYVAMVLLVIWVFRLFNLDMDYENNEWLSKGGAIAIYLAMALAASLWLAGVIVQLAGKKKVSNRLLACGYGVVALYALVSFGKLLFYPVPFTSYYVILFLDVFLYSAAFIYLIKLE